MDLSKSQIRKLGNRLRAGPPSEDDLWQLDLFRRSFGPAYEEVKRGITEDLGLQLTGRPQKTTDSIVAKLQREKTSLPRMQDIAGCRIVVSTCPEQDSAVQRICSRFPGSKPKDRRNEPSHGYRAVHIVVPASGRLVEVQVRTTLQDGWAQMSEKLADIFGIDVKYGGGPQVVQKVLALSSRRIAELELIELALAFMPREGQDYEDQSSRVETLKKDLAEGIDQALAALGKLQ